MRSAQSWVSPLLHCRNGPRTRYLSRQPMTEREIVMTALRTALNAVLSALKTAGASIEAARAVRAHRRPSDATLRQLGIPRDSFPANI